MSVYRQAVSTQNNNCQTLYLAIGVLQLLQLKQTGMRELRCHSPRQAFIFLKQSRNFAKLIAECWFAARDGVGYVVELHVTNEYIEWQEQNSIAYAEHQEIKIPVSELDDLNRNLLAPIDVVSTHGAIEKALARAYSPQQAYLGQVHSFN